MLKCYQECLGIIVRPQLGEAAWHRVADWGQGSSSDWAAAAGLQGGQLLDALMLLFLLLHPQFPD